MTTPYPQTFDDIAAWAHPAGVPVVVARVRFAQYGILRAISASNELARVLVLKGGNALDFVWEPNRSTGDLDFSARSSTLDEERLDALFAEGLAVASRELGTTYRVHSVDRQPPGPEKTFVTYTVRIGFALRDDAGSRAKLVAGKPSPQMIPVEISINEPICANQLVELSEEVSLSVSTVEDIVAEKLRALLQQPIRNRHRCQDLLDIAVLLRAGKTLSPSSVGQYLLTKAAAREVPVSKAAFRNPEVIARARQDYDALKATTRRVFIPHDEALAAVLGLVDRLEIPEG